MKIAFDIKYRPEIESGKYKLITTLGDSVEVLTWDAKGDLGPIVGLVKEKREDRVLRWRIDGPGLLIITDDQDLTPFEAALAQFITEKSKIPLRLSPLRDWIRSAAKRLLAIAKEEIEQTETYQVEQCKNYNSGFRTGMNMAKKIVGYRLFTMKDVEIVRHAAAIDQEYAASLTALATDLEDLVKRQEYDKLKQPFKNQPYNEEDCK